MSSAQVGGLLSNQEAVNAFVEGRISRRTLIRSLIAAGVSTGAAVSYAHLLSPERANAARPAYDDEYPQCFEEYPSVDMVILDGRLDRVVKRRELRVRIRYSAGFQAQSDPRARLSLLATTKRNGTVRPIGSRTFGIEPGRARELAIPLDPIGPLRNRSKAPVTLDARRLDGPFCRPFGSEPSGLIRIKRVLR